jgi:hypothetical protein
MVNRGREVQMDGQTVGALFDTLVDAACLASMVLRSSQTHLRNRPAAAGEKADSLDLGSTATPIDDRLVIGMRQLILTHVCGHLRSIS